MFDKELNIVNIHQLCSYISTRTVHNHFQDVIVFTSKISL